EAIHLSPCGVMDCFVAEPVIGPAQEGRTRWLLAMTKLYSASPFNNRGTSPDNPAAWRMNMFFSGGARSTMPSPMSRTVRNKVDLLENRKFSELVASPIAMVSKRRQR